MIEIMNPVRVLKDSDNCLDPQLWHACAGGMVQMPPLNSNVIYFPQGHIEHAQVSLDSTTFPKIPPLLPCRISAIKYLADRDTDEVFAKIRLIPLRNHEFDFADDAFPAAGAGADQFDGLEKPASFAKTLTQSDANNGGGFSVPRYCAETIFPRLDYSAEPPVQTILAKDVHGVTWKFRHIYRGTPRRHLLTTGWSNFVNQKKLVAGDSIVFLRADNGDLCVGIRRAKKGIGGGPESPCAGWNGNCGSPYGGYAAFLRDDDTKMLRSMGRVGSGMGTGMGLGPSGKVAVESVIEAANLASKGQPFEVVYYPRASTPEFCVKAASVRGAMQVQWCAGMRFKMAFETEDSSRISWFMGTISGVQVADQLHWPNSPWRLLQVAWDEPELLQNVKRVNPWLVEMVASMPAIHMSPFSPPPRKKARLPQPHDFPFVDQIPMPPFMSNPLKPSGAFGCISAGIQGARHAQFGRPTTTIGKMQLGGGLFPAFPKHPENPAIVARNFLANPDKGCEDVSCVLTMGSGNQVSKKSDDRSSSSVTPKFMLFGKAILTKDQISQSSSGDSSGNSGEKGMNNCSDGSSGGRALSSSEDRESASEPRLVKGGECKVFMESKEVEMYKKLANMFGMERAEMLRSVMVSEKPLR